MASIVLGVAIPTVTAWHILSGNEKISACFCGGNSEISEKPGMYQLGKAKVLLL